MNKAKYEENIAAIARLVEEITKDKDGKITQLYNELGVAHEKVNDLSHSLQKEREKYRELQEKTQESEQLAHHLILECYDLLSSSIVITCFSKYYDRSSLEDLKDHLASYMGVDRLQSL